MPLPDFNADEQYLINCIKSPNASANSGSSMWGYIVGSALVAGVAAYHENTLIMLAAFLIVCGSRIYEERFQSRWMPHWRSIIEKYESASNAIAPEPKDEALD
ncbi:MAG: hypothetical protein AAGI63_19785 [Planctomycetota bacterium]